MGQTYGYLSAVERNFLQSSLHKGHGQGAIARASQRSPSLISREIGRSGRDRTAYDAAAAGQAARARVRRGQVKLGEGTALHRLVFARIKLAWSPQQISGGLRVMKKSDLIGFGLPDVSRETIHRAIHVLPRGEPPRNSPDCCASASLCAGRGPRPRKGAAG